MNTDSTNCTLNPLQEILGFCKNENLFRCADFFSPGFVRNQTIAIWALNLKIWEEMWKMSSHFPPLAKAPKSWKNPYPKRSLYHCVYLIRAVCLLRMPEEK